MHPGSTGESISCRVIALPVGESLYSLRFEIRNAGTEPIEFSTYEPFTAFSVVGTAGNKPLTVHQPALDIPIKPVTFRVPPKSSVALTTPIRLRISEGAGPGTDGFIWTIPHDRGALSLQVKLNLPEPFGVVCPVVFE
jgi:hypothetical protein